MAELLRELGLPWPFLALIQPQRSHPLSGRFSGSFLDLDKFISNSTKILQDSFQQHDVQELCRVLFDALETTFQGTVNEKLVNNLYQGERALFGQALDPNGSVLFYYLVVLSTRVCLFCRLLARARALSGCEILLLAVGGWASRASCRVEAAKGTSK